MQFIVTGATLRVLPISNISESSILARDLCVELMDVRGVLERNVIVNIVFAEGESEL